MDEQDVRAHAQAYLDALVAGDVERAIQDLSREMRSNLGEDLAMMPLPLPAHATAPGERAGSGLKRRRTTRFQTVSIDATGLLSAAPTRYDSRPPPLFRVAFRPEVSVEIGQVRVAVVRAGRGIAGRVVRPVLGLHQLPPAARSDPRGGGGRAAHLIC